MLPASEELESFHSRLRELCAQLGRYRGAEVKRSDVVAAIAAISKEWLALSSRLRTSDLGDRVAVDAFDEHMRAALNATTQRTRSTGYLKSLTPVSDGFIDTIVVPLIRFEGSPSQVAARQLQSAFSATLTAEELAYVDEASRCVSVRAYRAAMIMLWAAGMSRLHRAVESVGFTAFNAAWAAASAKKGSPFSRLTKPGSVSSLPELQKMRDFDLVVIGMDLWHYDMPVCEELERLLGTRNSAAHPGMLQPTSLDVQQFANKVNAYVFGKVVV